MKATQSANNYLFSAGGARVPSEHQDHAFLSTWKIKKGARVLGRGQQWGTNQPSSQLSPPPPELTKEGSQVNSCLRAKWGLKKSYPEEEKKQTFIFRPEIKMESELTFLKNSLINY